MTINTTTSTLLLLFKYSIFTILIYLMYRNEYNSKKEGVEKMLVDLVLKVNYSAPKARD